MRSKEAAQSLVDWHTLFLSRWNEWVGEGLNFLVKTFPIVPGSAKNDVWLAGFIWRMKKLAFLFLSPASQQNWDIWHTPYLVCKAGLTIHFVLCPPPLLAFPELHCASFDWFNIKLKVTQKTFLSSISGWVGDFACTHSNLQKNG